jgi:hypothetical protein
MQAWAGFAQTVAIVYVANRGVDALQTWRRQKIAERKLETAERVLTLAYRLRIAFEGIRHPAMSGSELAAAEQFIKDNGDWLGSGPIDVSIAI